MEETPTLEGIPDLKLTGDAVNSLTVQELRIANGKLRADVVHAITEPTADRWDGLALVAWILAKRQEPTIPLTRFTELSIAELMQILTPPDDPNDGLELEAGAGAGTPARELDDLAAEAAANPTGRPA